MLRTLLLPLILFLLSGCALLAPSYERPEAAVPKAWPEMIDSNAGQRPADLPWQEFFADSQLRQVIALALENNLDLRVALLNIERFRAAYRIQRAELLPHLDVSAAGSRGRVPADLSSTGQSEIYQQYSVNLGVSAYELDLFGRVASLKEQALQQYLASEEAKRSVQISLVSRIAASWLTLAADRQKLQLARETLANQQEVYRILKSRFEAGISSALDLQQAQTSVDAARVDIARFTTLVGQDENLLRLLVGSSIPPQLLISTLPESLTTEAALAPGLPSESLLRRPDILQAENLLKGANANIGAARAAFFPRITLVSSIGTGSDQLSGLFTGDSQAWNFSPSITLPIFSAGSNLAHLDVAKVDRELAVARYQQSIQTAFREVADALARLQTITQQLEAQQSLTDATARSYQLSLARYQKGVDSYLTALDSQRALYGARKDLIDTRLVRLTNLVRLYQVLGGGAV